MTFRTLFVALFALLLSACAPAPAQQGIQAIAAPGPALWRVADEDTTIWLFGTIHILPQGYRWRSAAIDGAIAGSDELVIETVLPSNQSESAVLLMQLGVTPDLPPIGARVAPELRPRLAAMIARGPFPEPFLDSLESWAAALMLVGVTLNDLDLEAGSGADDQLERAFRRASKPVSGFEQPGEQLGFFDALPEEAQRDFLASVIDAPGDVRAEYDAMLAAWSRGDEAAISASFDDELAVSPVLRDALLIRRNAAWARWIAARMEDPGEVFVAVGAGHLAGRDSVQDFLRAAGVQSARVQ